MCDAEPPAVAALLAALRASGAIRGASLMGAGGGGFMLLVTRRPRAKAEVEALLARAGGAACEVYEAAVDVAGMEVALEA